MRLTDWLAPSLAVAIVSAGLTGAASAQELGGIKGSFILDGDIPELDLKVTQGENVKDAAVCAATDVPDQSIVVDADSKGIANVFIWIKKFDEDDIPEKLAKPTEKLELDQKGCVFLPHAAVARTGQEMVMLNGDAVAHNVHVNAIRGDAINPLIAANDRKGQSHVFKKPDILPVPVTCDIHPWMRANLLVLEHPYGTVSDEKGAFEIADIPEGKYDFTVWHEAAGFVRGIKEVNNVEIEAGKVLDLGELAVDAKDLE